MNDPDSFVPRNDNLDQILRAFRRRLRLVDGWLIAQRALWIPAAAMLGIQMIGRLFPIGGISTGLLRQPWFWALILAWGIAVMLYTLLKPLSLMQTALRVDASIGLKERLSSALALRQMDDVPQMFRQRQRADALNHARAIQPREAFPIPWLRKPVAFAGAIFALSILSIWLPNPMDAIRQERAAAKQAILEEAQKIAALKQQIESGETAEELTPAQREELLRQLEALERALQANPGDLEQALADLNRLEQELRQNLDPSVGAKQAYLDALTEQLSRLSGKQPAAGSNNPAATALQDLLDGLDRLEADSASAEKQRQEAARSLAQLAAQASQVGDNNLSQALSSLRQALQDGDPQAMDAAAQAAQAALQQLKQQLDNQQAIQGVLAQAQSSQQALTQAGRQIAQSQGKNSPAAGQPAGPSSSGASPGGASGQPSGTGGGSMANQLPPSTGGQTSVQPRGSAAAAQTGAFDPQIYAPWQRSSTSGEQLFIPGQDTNQGQTSTTEGQSPQAGLPNPALMPYSQVFFQYLSAANQAMQQNYIPANLQDYVRLYFSSLEPK